MTRFAKAAWTIFALAVCASRAQAQQMQTSPAPSPTETASPPPGLHVRAQAYTVYVDTAANGAGLTPPEGTGFANGSPLSPMTPYDTFSSAPQSPGESGTAQLLIAGTYGGSRYDASATLGIGALTGSTQNALYWTENVMPSMNPHLGSTAVPYTIAFPSHAGEDDASVAQIAPLQASFGAHGGEWLLRAGYFDLAQTERFVFAAPPLTNVTPSIGLTTPETLGDGAPSLDSWPTPEPGLPLNGVDLTAHRGNASIELSDAALPSLPGTSARMMLGSIAIDRGNGSRISAEVLHAVTGGDEVSTTTMYGAGAHTVPGPQGPLPVSTLRGQVETIAGVHANLALTRTIDGVAEIGRTWYDAAGVLDPGTAAPGGLYHLGVSGHRGRMTIALDGYRFEARYANMILPYGTPENVWSVAWAWPGVWLKSTYQLVDNLQYPGSNRQGFRLKYALAGGPVEVRASAATFHQIDPAMLSNVNQTGFVDGFFLPQFDDSGTLGMQRQYALWADWHAPAGDLTLDYVDDLMHRGFVPAHPEDDVSYQAPQAVLTFSHQFSKAVIAAAGAGRYAMKGSYGQPFTNVDYFQNVYFAGVQMNESPHGSLLLQIHRSAFAGAPSIPNGPSPDFHATSLIVEQRIR